MFPTPRVKSTSNCRMCLFVSSNWNSTCAVLADARMAANQKGVAAVNHDTTDGSASTPPRNGPMMNPTPNAAPIMPKFFVRSCGDVTSAMAACATDRVGDHEMSRMPEAELDEVRGTEIGMVLQGAARNLLPYLSARGNVGVRPGAARRRGRDVPGADEVAATSSGFTAGSRDEPLER